MRKKSKSFKPIMMPSDMTKNPRKIFLDPREHISGGYRVEIVCPQCKVLNHNKFNCYYCGYQICNKVSITFNHKVGGRIMSDKAYKHMVEETTGKNAKDYLQPMRWNNITRKMEKNPEYIKVYGDPFKSNEKPKTTKKRKTKK